MQPTTVLGVKGFNDVLPGHSQPFLHSALWQEVWRTAGEVLTSYGFAPVWLPLLEEASLFVRGLGDATDVVQKEMYTLRDRGDRHLALRPEGTAGAVRAYLEHSYAHHAPQQRWFYQGPMFRAERPQKGRYRQFYQLGAEYFGSPGPGADVELLLLLNELCRALGLPTTTLNINTLGDSASRAAYKMALTTFLRSNQGALCAACRARSEQNPLRVLDCKEASCRKVLMAAPDVLASLTPASRQWFDGYCKLLDRTGLSYSRNRQLVRGLDYYTEAIFELTTSALGAQDAVFGGGRYDGLVEALGGPAVPAVGFAAGVERLVLLLAEQRPPKPKATLLLAALDEQSIGDVLALSQAVRSRALAVVTEAEPLRLKVALKRAARLQPTAFLAISQLDRDKGRGRLRAMASGVSNEVALDQASISQALNELISRQLNIPAERR